jgi:hypothetical protein
MCQAFSCIVTRSGKCYWKTGLDSHDSIVSEFNLRDDTTDEEEMGIAKIEIIPATKIKYPYLYPELKWKLKIDENKVPTWVLQKHKDSAWAAWQNWKDEVYQFDYKALRKPINPFTLKASEPQEIDIDNLLKWDSVWASVGASVWASVRDSVWASVRDSVGDSVRDSVWDSVWDSVKASVWASVSDSVGASVWDSVRDSVGAYTGSNFPNIKQWEYVKHTEGQYPYQPCVDLWLKGFIPSFDSKIWRLHSGKNAKIVFEISKEDLLKRSK